MKSIDDAYFERYVKPKMMKRIGMKKPKITQKRTKRMKKQWRLKL